MPGGETEYVRRSTTHETYRSQTPIAKKLLDDKGIDSIVAEKGCHGIKSKIGGWENTGFGKLLHHIYLGTRTVYRTYTVVSMLTPGHPLAT